MYKYFAVFLFLGLTAVAQDGSDPFSVEALYDSDEGTLSVQFEIPPEHFLYADSIHINMLAGGSLSELSVPAPLTVRDPFSESEKKVYKDNFSMVYRLEARGDSDRKMELEYQGCNKTVCFFPQVRRWTFSAEPSTNTSSHAFSLSEGMTETSWQTHAERFRVVARASGFMGSGRFLSFLGDAEKNGEAIEHSKSRFEGLGIWSALLLILLGGMALNLTPCVLPMIPINLAIIGAGTQAGSRTRGLLLGGAYGLAIAVTYGVLGLVVVLTGATFGTLNASPWFNGVMAAVFVVLALAMFDVLHIDFSRFQTRLGGTGKPPKAGYLAAFGVGTVSALLAGACVAPVVIGVLVWSQNLFAKGVTTGLALPFVLGLGMGLPWPLAGAGLSFLPRPGRWMTWVKMAFGVFILLLALYYGHLAYTGLKSTPLSAGQLLGEGEARVILDKSTQDLSRALIQAQASGQRVFIDFWATWCKNCHAMEETTFKEPAVVEALSAYVTVKVQAERPSDPVTKAMLEYFGVLGLPTYVVLEPLP